VVLERSFKISRFETALLDEEKKRASARFFLGAAFKTNPNKEYV
jgi:hypothetical protein